MRSAFPQLRARGAQHGIQIVDIDLNWGITNDTASYENILALVGSELNRASIVVCLLGERFGGIPQGEYDSLNALEIYAALASKSAELIVLHRAADFTAELARGAPGSNFFETDPGMAIEQSKLIRRLGYLGVPLERYRSIEEFADAALRSLETILERRFFQKRGAVFISYSRQDIDLADRLFRSFEAANFDVWFDKKGIALGDEWPETLASAINECDVVLFIASKASVQSDYAVREVLYAMKRGKPILAFHNGAVELPDSLDLMLGTVQHVRSQDHDTFEGALDVVIQGLAKQIATTKPPAKNHL